MNCQSQDTMHLFKTEKASTNDDGIGKCTGTILLEMNY